LKVTNRRVNALEFVIMPQLNNTIKYIISELDEMEREDQYRIKKVKDIRTRLDDEEQAENDKIELAARVAAHLAQEGATNSVTATPVDAGADSAAAASKPAGGKKKKNKGDKVKDLTQESQQYAVDALLE